MTVPDEAHALDAAAVAHALKVDSTVGLSAAEAGQRAITAGPNALEASRREPLWKMLLDASEANVV